MKHTIKHNRYIKEHNVNLLSDIDLDNLDSDINRKNINNRIDGIHAIHGTNNYRFVDLDLPSKTLWAECNVGAVNPWDTGDYFAWGETTTKPSYCWQTYKFGTVTEITKYNLTDGICKLQLCDDCARANMGGKWHMPTVDQINELSELYHVYVDNYNNSRVNGILYYGNNGNTIFFPSTRTMIYDTKGNEICTYIISNECYPLPSVYIQVVQILLDGKHKVVRACRPYGYTVRAVIDNRH